MKSRIQAVIFDWAGTVVDYGCFAPIEAFIGAFQDVGIEITLEEARKPMGLLKMDHIKEILNMKRVREEWKTTFATDPEQGDIDDLYSRFEKKLFENLHVFTDPIPGTTQTINILKSKNIKIGSTTGYTREMIDVVARHAKEKGYEPDCIVCSDEVQRGRPFPYMIFQNMTQLEVFPPKEILKVGDTVTDMMEGKNAGVWTIGIVKGSSELGLTEDEVLKMDEQSLMKRIDKVTQRFKNAGADYVIVTIEELPEVVNKIEKQL
ncbi:phosphonoacetaldehyde hydrolase [Evansella halocellulosilytica]|uniref:phosphonoacetaldehyde hydrolase n=1 Tax=Evansella halocellulosilytica TaxID=2011013 RepID=UPI000BB97D4F|nr:phosphonoacetaldehyde hydrolase [Evansella halocellulosilytica]